MKRLAALALVASAAITTIAALTQDHAMPNPVVAEHALLERYAGTWEAEVSMMGVTSPATETNRLVGKTWVVGDFDGSFGDMPFQGHSVLGWNADEEVYISTWVDSMSARMSIQEGTYDAGAKTLTMTGKGVGMTGEEVDERTVTTFESDDAHKFEMYQGDALIMTIQYKRKK